MPSSADATQEKFKFWQKYFRTSHVAPHVDMQYEYFYSGTMGR